MQLLEQLLRLIPECLRVEGPPIGPRFAGRRGSVKDEHLNRSVNYVEQMAAAVNNFAKQKGKVGDFRERQTRALYEKNYEDQRRHVESLQRARMHDMDGDSTTF